MGIFKRKPKKDRKKFRDTRAGKFLKEKGSKLLDIVGDVTGVEALNNVADLISNEKGLSPEDKAHAIKLIELEQAEMQQVTDRWKFDMEFGNVLSKSIRPAVLAWLILLFTIVLLCDLFGVQLSSSYLATFETVLLTVVAAYFGMRSLDKYHSRKYGEQDEQAD